MANTASTNSNQVGQYVPLTMWKDLTVEEKLERIREQVKHTQNQYFQTNGQVQDLRNDFSNHAHLDGKVVKDIKTSNLGFGSLAKLNNLEKEASGEVYF